MELKRIHLKNYRRYKDQEIEFPTGIIGIVGRNGSGKSTIIEAIGWCMYGNDAARTNKDQIRTTGVPKGEDCSVTLEMVLGSDTVRIIRELKGKNASGYASVFLNGYKTAHVRGSREVSEFVAKRIGMDRVAFFTSVFAKQKELDALSDLQPEKRKKTIMRLLRINRIDDAIQAIRCDIHESTDRISLLESNLKDIRALEEQQQEASERREQTEQQINIQTDMIKELKTEEAKKKAEFSTHQKKYQMYNKANNVRVTIKAQIMSKRGEREITDSDLRTAKDSKNKLQGILLQVEEYKVVKKEKTALDILYGSFTQKKMLEGQCDDADSQIEQILSANKRIDGALAKSDGLESDLKIQKNRLAGQKKHEEKLVTSISAVSAKITAEEKQRSGLMGKFAKIKSLGSKGNCPTCSQPLKDHFARVSKQFTGGISTLDKVIKKDLNEKKDVESNLRSLKKGIQACSKKISGIEAMVKKKDSLQIQLREGKKSLVATNLVKLALTKKLKKFSGIRYDRKHHMSVNRQFEKLSKINNKSIELSTDAKRIPHLSKRYKMLSETISRLEEKQKKATKRLDSVGYDKLEYKRAEEDLEQSSATHSKAREAQIELKGNMDTITMTINHVDAQIKEQNTRQAEIDEENKKIGLRSKLEQIMKDFRLDLISRIKPVLSQRSSELFREVTRGRYSMMDLDENYSIRIEDDGGSFTTNRFSGGEGDLANLCLRVAISQELMERSGGMQANFIALDEIFGSQDGERKKSVLETLSALSGQFKQILVITHVEDIKDVLPYVLTVVEEQEGTVRIETEGFAPV